MNLLQIIWFCFISYKLLTTEQYFCTLTKINNNTYAPWGYSKLCIYIRLSKIALPQFSTTCHIKLENAILSRERRDHILNNSRIIRLHQIYHNTSDKMVIRRWVSFSHTRLSTSISLVHWQICLDSDQKSEHVDVDARCAGQRASRMRNLGTICWVNRINRFSGAKSSGPCFLVLRTQSPSNWTHWLVLARRLHSVRQAQRPPLNRFM